MTHQCWIGCVHAVYWRESRWLMHIGIPSEIASILAAAILIEGIRLYQHDLHEW
jgi:hypothetical protein